MGTITVRLPDDAHKRIKELAASRKTSVNKLYEEFTIIALTEFDAENRFKALASKGNKKRGLELLKKLQNHFEDN
ncbi:MAG: toxin-antitoxin system HicB family antitoxin [Desulfobacteraceae bacterium]|jgi:hypothetical protein